MKMGNMSALEKSVAGLRAERGKKNASVGENARTKIDDRKEAGAKFSALEAFRRKMSKAGQPVEVGAKEKCRGRMWCGPRMSVSVTVDPMGNSIRAVKLDIEDVQKGEAGRGSTASVTADEECDVSARMATKGTGVHEDRGASVPFGMAKSKEGEEGGGKQRGDKEKERQAAEREGEGGEEEEQLAELTTEGKGEADLGGERRGVVTNDGAAGDC